MRHLTENDVRSALDARELIAALRAAFARGWRDVRMPTRMQLQLAVGGVLLMMPCYNAATPAAGVKLVSVSPQGGVRATYLLLDPATVATVATIEADWLTDLRTAATSALASDLLARDEARTLGIFGAGRQAWAHALTLPLVRKFDRVLVCGTSRAKSAAFSRRLASEYSLPAEVADAETCAAADVVCTCTTASEPVLCGAWLRPGAHVNLVGAFQPATREADDDAMARDRFVVDTYEGAFDVAGDVLLPLANGAIRSEI